MVILYLWLDIDEYIDSGFLALQRSIDKAYIELATDQTRDEFKVNSENYFYLLDIFEHFRYYYRTIRA